MATKKLQLTDSQHEGWSHFLDEQALADSRRRRFLAACLAELGGKLDEPWQFHEPTETFWMNVPDEPSTDTGTNRKGDESVATR